MIVERIFIVERPQEGPLVNSSELIYPRYFVGKFRLSRVEGNLVWICTRDRTFTTFEQLMNYFAEKLQDKTGLKIIKVHDEPRIVNYAVIIDHKDSYL